MQVWGLFVALGMLLSCGVVMKRAKDYGFKSDELLEQAIWGIVGGFIGARLFHVFVYEPGYYLQHIIEILFVWQGGMSSFGGILGALLGFLVYQKRKKISLASFVARMDVFAYASVFGWMLGRVGCVMIHDHMGKPCDCMLAIDTPIGKRLDMAILEILGLVPLAIIFFVFRKRFVAREGWFVSILLMYYGVLRLVLDQFRAVDIVHADVRYLGLTPGQYSAIVLILTGLLLYKKTAKRHIR